MPGLMTCLRTLPHFSEVVRAFCAIDSLPNKYELRAPVHEPGSHYLAYPGRLREDPFFRVVVSFEFFLFFFFEVYMPGQRGEVSFE